MTHLPKMSVVIGDGNITLDEVTELSVEEGVLRLLIPRVRDSRGGDVL